MNKIQLVISRGWIFMYLILAGLYLINQDNLAFPVNAVVKAVPILFLALFSWLLLQGRLRMWMCLALLFSATWDVMLATPVALSFPLGLSAFLVAQLIYLGLFWQGRGDWHSYGRAHYIGLGLMATFYGVMIVFMLPRTGELMAPVAVYMTAITAMGVAAVLYRGSPWVTLGALTFVLSDTVIALDKFWLAIDSASLIIMVTYYLAQLMIFVGMAKAVVIANQNM